MGMNQPPPGKVPDLTDLGGKVSVRLIGYRRWLWRFLGICLLAAVVGGPASLAGGVYQETSPSAEVQNAWLTASVGEAQTITFGQPPDVSVGAPVTLSASASSGLPVSFSPDTTPVCTVAGSAVTTVAAGTCTITASQGGGLSDRTLYAAAPDVTQSFEVNAAAQAITFGPLPGVTVGAPVTLSASASSGLPVSFSSGTTPVCTVAGSAVTTAAAGTCTITASQGGSARYAAAPDVTQSFQVNAAGQTITFGQPPDAKAGAPVTLSASASSGLPVSFSSGTTPVCTVAGSAVTTVAAGLCTITASQGGSTDYAAAPPLTQSFQVNLAAQTITFGPLPEVTVGAPVTLSASASSGLPVSFSSGTPSVCTVKGSAVTTVAAGPCTITASQGGSARYAAAPDVSRSFQVNPVNPGPAAQTITFGQPPDAKVGAPVTLSAHASSGLPVSFSSDTTPVCTVAGSVVTTVAAGSCTITASQGGSGRYAAAPDVRQSFQVNPVPPKAAGVWVILLAAVILAAAAATMVLRRRWLRSHPPPAPTPAANVRAVPDTGPPGLVSVHNSGTDATHTVRIEPSPGTSITTIEEARP